MTSRAQARRTRRRAAVAAACLAFAVPSPMDAAGADYVTFGAEAALESRDLREVRGGFVVRGLELRIGIERAIYIDGVLHTSATLRLGDAPQNDAPGGTLPDTGRVVHSGPGNVAPASLPPLVQVLQNTLDGRRIDVRTVLDVAVSNVGVYRSARTHELFRAALVGSLR